MKSSPVSQLNSRATHPRHRIVHTSKRRQMSFIWCLGIASIPVGGWARAATPQRSETAQRIPALREVVVTATKRAVLSQDVPFAITALDQRALLDRGAGSADEALNYVPAVSFTSNGANSGTYSIRGISTGGAVANAQSPVALYIDDISILDPTDPSVTMNLRLFDVSRVEVLEGPQGTLFRSGARGSGRE